MRLLIALLCLAGCSGDDPNNTPALCDAWVSAFCTKAAACSVQAAESAAGEEASYVALCRGETRTVLDCSRMTGINGDLQTCRRDVDSTPCALYRPGAGGLPIPASCRGIFR
jgi:hypothetical protein